MVIVVVFGGTLLASVLISDLSRRSVASTAVLFLIAGVIAGPVFGLIDLGPGDERTKLLIEVTVFATLFVEGNKVNLAQTWRDPLPLRALLVGMPLTWVGIALLAHFAIDVSWPEALLIGAVLSPTDVVFARQLFAREGVPLRLRRFLSLESGLNDGLALPLVVIMLDINGREDLDLLRLAVEVVGGVALGIAVAFAGIWAERPTRLGSASLYEPLHGLAIAAITFGLAHLLDVNDFLAAFAAGITIAATNRTVASSLTAAAEPVVEALKLAALLIFGSLLTTTVISDFYLGGTLLVIGTLLVVRPLALGVALLGTRLSMGVFGAAAWFGPRGFASVLYGLLVLGNGMERGEYLFHGIALVIASSMVLHSSTDALLARRLANLSEEGPDDEVPDTQTSQKREREEAAVEA
ncbi:MAG: cation:proton antiporter [Dehalococcoidia bacterium]